MFSRVLHVVGSPDSADTPSPDGPRHCGQLAAIGAAASRTPTTTRAIRIVPAFCHGSMVLLLLRHAPRHPFREVSLKVRPPSADGLARILSRSGRRIAKPSVVLADELSTPAGLRRVGGIVAAERQEEEPRGRVAFFQTAVRIWRCPGLRQGTEPRAVHGCARARPATHGWSARRHQ